MINRTNTLIFLILLCAVGCGSCGSVNGPYYDSAKNPDPSLSDNDGVFPHNSEWKDLTKHGKYVIDKGFSSCQNACHGEKFEGGSARSCKTCHADFLHPSSEIWNGIAGHGKYVIEQGSTNACATGCHGKDLKGGYDPNDKKSCSKCHTSYPLSHNTKGWSHDGHGKFVKTTGDSTECGTMCHRADVPKELKIKQCADCHPSYPEQHKSSSKWVKEGGHGKFLLNYGGITTSDCTICHGAKLEGGSSEIACAISECHHKGEGEWKDASAHGSVAYSKFSECQACHGKDTKGNSVVEGCDGCHHDSWSDWIKGTEHGGYGKEPATECKLCHGDDLSGGVAAKACSTCHGDIYPHKEGWEGKDKHGLAAKSDLSKCKNCHNNVTSPDCKSCHHDNNPQWQPTDHSQLAKLGLDGCKTCHGSDLKGGEAGKTCYECHDPADSYEHPEGWNEAVQHGVTYRNDKTACQTACHGTDLNSGISGIACKSCHTEYPHPEDWASWNHGALVLTSDDQFDSAKFDTGCANCHGQAEKFTKQFNNVTSFTTPTGVGRCYICHANYPHPGFKDYIGGLGTVDEEWDAGHWYYIVFNFSFAGKNDAGKDTQIKMLDKGCADMNGGACHAAGRHGPLKNYAGCGTLCHK